MAKSFVLALALVGCDAYVSKVGPVGAPGRPARGAALSMMDASEMEGAQAPFGYFDPMGLAKTSPEALAAPLDPTPLRKFLQRLELCCAESPLGDAANSSDESTFSALRKETAAARVGTEREPTCCEVM